MVKEIGKERAAGMGEVKGKDLISNLKGKSIKKYSAKSGVGIEWGSSFGYSEERLKEIFD